MTEQNIINIMKKYQAQQGISKSEFTRQINAVLAPNPPITHGAVCNWFAGIRRPRYYVVLMIYMHGQGWVTDWALEILRELKPELYEL
jgi:hypothetical protein